MSGPEAPFGAGRSEPSDPVHEENDPPVQLDEFLARAVDRQIAEQRALRQTLGELREALEVLRTKPTVPPVDLDALRENVRTTVEASAAPILSEVRELKEGLETMKMRQPSPQIDADDLREHLRREIQSNAGAVTNEIRDLRETVVPGVQRAIDATASVRGVEQDMVSLREAVGNMSADLEGMAQALIELNAGLRDWADGIDNSVATIKDSVDRMASLDEDAGPPSQPLLEVADVEQRMKESVELSLYLADQIDGFDRVIHGMSDLPTKLEAVVSQALRRTLTARAKLDAEAEAAMEDAVVGLDGSIEKMEDVIEHFSSSDEAIRKLTRGQVELASRVEDLQEAVIDRIEELEDERRRTEEALATAIDALGHGRDPRAAALVERASSGKPAKRKPTAAAKGKTKGSKPKRRRASSRPSDEPAGD